MLRSVNELSGYRIAALDGSAGTLREMYFEDENWQVRYLVVDTGNWLPGRLVLVSPVAVTEPDWASKSIAVNLSQDRIEKSPVADAARPVSRSFEIEMLEYYGWPHNTFRPDTDDAAESGGAATAVKSAAAVDDEANLRSTREVSGYAIASSDGEIGHVEDLILDDETFVLRYVAVDTRNWLPGRKVLVAMPWVDRVDWPGRALHVNLTKQQIKDGPEFNPAEPVNRRYEARLYDFYGRPSYWERHA